jgi:16S rRNA G966 N2-methylase RsmD
MTRSAGTYDLVLIDPPYGQALQLGPRLSAALEGVLAPRARVVLESDRRMPLDLGLVLEKERRYGDTTIAIHRHA